MLCQALSAVEGTEVNLSIALRGPGPSPADGSGRSPGASPPPLFTEFLPVVEARLEEKETA